jgi:acetyl esterase/lipase
VLLAPWPVVPREVRARRGLTYGPDARANRFDLYMREDGGPARGVLVHIHGGHFRAGGPSRESRAMLFDHASRGWAAISTTYHLSPTPESGFPQHLVDIKQLIRWIRETGPAHGIPADAPIVVAGSSAGAHIAMMTALTAGEPAYQPGFEDLDTALAGVVGLYGYYGRLGAATKDVSDPARLSAAGAPPAAIIHGTADTYTPVKGSRRLVRHLREQSANPVMYAELPGAQHGFDAVRTPRYLAVVAAVAEFTDLVAPHMGAAHGGAARRGAARGE